MASIWNTSDFRSNAPNEWLTPLGGVVVGTLLTGTGAVTLHTDLGPGSSFGESAVGGIDKCEGEPNIAVASGHSAWADFITTVFTGVWETGEDGFEAA